MKHFLFVAAVLAMGTAAFTSCSKDDNDYILPEITDTTKTFTVTKGESLMITPNYSNLDGTSTYSWKDDNGNVISNESSLKLTNPEIGTFNYTVYVKNSTGAISYKYTVIVEPILATVDFEGESWTRFIDAPQYGGQLIYSADDYSWTDAVTSLSSSCAKADWTAYGMGYGWENGIAISNYIDASEAASYDKQLSVPVSNGSNNFAIVWDNGSQLTFADGKAHTIKSMDVCPTTYSLRNVEKNAAEGYEFKVIATGIRSNGSTTTCEIVLAAGEDVKKNWFNVDLSSLGSVKTVEFTFDGTDKSEWGLQTPKYFALDNVVVVL